MPYIANRVREGEEGVFSLLQGWIAEAQKAGKEIINLGIGSPNRCPEEPILEAALESAKEHCSYEYPFIDPELPKAIAKWYGERFGVSLDPKCEVVPLWGSQEGFAHFPLVAMESGDLCILPDPGYPIYHYMPTMVDGSAWYLPLEEDNGFLPDFARIPEDVAAKARFMVLNYPNNPLGVAAEKDVLEKAVTFCRENDIWLLYDNAYCELAYDGFRPPSVLEIEGASEVAVEVNSFSKTFNMAGMRIGFAVGNKVFLEALGRLKSNIDYGLYKPVQKAAICALTHPDRDEMIARTRTMYQARRDAFLGAAAEKGWVVTPPRGSMFIWAKVPGCTDDMAFAEFCIKEAGVVVTPGRSFGRKGTGFVRIGLVKEPEVLAEGASRIAETLEKWRCVSPSGQK
jgi:aspartate/methionine/tyrosine aminotransferase